MSETPPFSIPYVNDAGTQIDGSRFQQENCVVKVACCLIDVSSLGYYRVSAAKFRNECGDYSGGITYDTAANTAPKVTNGEVQLYRIYWAPSGTLDDLLETKRIVGLSIWTRRLLSTPFALGGSFGHTVEVGRAFYDSHGVKRYWVMDPGHSDADWEAWPASLLMACAHDRTGNNTLHILYTRDLTNVSRKARSRGAIRTAPSGAAARVGTVLDDAIYRVETSVRGESWSTGRGYNARGWSKLGDKRYTMGLRIR